MGDAAARQGAYLLEGLLCSRILIHIRMILPSFLPAATCKAFTPLLRSALSHPSESCTSNSDAVCLASRIRRHAITDRAMGLMVKCSSGIALLGCPANRSEARGVAVSLLDTLYIMLDTVVDTAGGMSTEMRS